MLCCESVANSGVFAMLVVLGFAYIENTTVLARLRGRVFVGQENYTVINSVNTMG